MFIVAAAAISLVNDLPAMILSVSRLVFAWAEDGIFPRAFSHVSPRFHTPTRAILLSSATSSVGIVGNHVSGDFFLGVGLLLSAMLVNFLLMALSVLALPRRNPGLAARCSFMRRRSTQLWVAGTAAAMLSALIAIQIVKDVTAPADAWYFRACYTYLVVLAAGSLIFAFYWRRLKASGVDVDERFSGLPEQ